MKMGWKKRNYVNVEEKSERRTCMVFHGKLNNVHILLRICDLTHNPHPREGEGLSNVG